MRYFHLITLLAFFLANPVFGSSLGARSRSSNSSSEKLPYLCGVNLAGYEFGISPWASSSKPQPPSVDQIPHFIDQGANVIRVPMAWESIQPTLNQELSSAILQNYSSFISQITEKKAYAVIDIHNYARREGKVVGEDSAVPATALVDLWVRLAKAFQDNSLVIFGLMNEPHDQQWKTWTSTLQSTVTGIREEGAKNFILLPGERYATLELSNQTYSGLKGIKNPDGTFDGLVFEFHRYLDSDGSGTSTECTSDRVSEIQAAASLLNADGRQALIAETGGGNTQSCQEDLPKFLQAVKNAYPAIVGAVLWGAGSFDTVTNYALQVTSRSGGTYQDQLNWASIKKFLPGATS